MKVPFPRSVAGLPLHPMLVHFPLVFWLCLPLLDIAALRFGLQPWWTLVLGATAAGVLIGIPALLTGLREYLCLSETGSNDVRLAARHGVRTTLIWCVQTLKCIAVWLLPADPLLLSGCLIVDLLAGALLVQAWVLGTRITYGGYGH